MKRFFCLLSILWLSIMAFAEGPDFRDGNLYYKLIDGECYVYGLVNEGVQKLVIPSTATVNGRTFTVIGVMGAGNETYRFPGVKEIVLPQSITFVGKHAFCSNSLESIQMDGVETLGFRAFYRCINLKSISFKKIKYIESNVFEGCKSLKKLVIPSSCQEVGNNVLYDCSNPDLTIIIEDSKNPLSFCSDFYTCNGKKLYIGRNLECWEDYWNRMTSEYYGIIYLKDLYYFKEVVFGDEVTLMPAIYSKREYRYRDYSLFEHLTIGASIKRVREFSNDDNIIKSIHMVSETPPVVEGEFSSRTYLYCKLYVPLGSIAAYKKAPVWREFFNIEEYGPKKPLGKGGNAWYDLNNGTLRIMGHGGVNLDDINISADSRKAIKALVILDGITSIYKMNVSNFYSSLTSVTIPNSVTSIGNGAFSGCSSLTSVTIPNSVTSIGNGAFSGCSNLTSVTIPNSVTSIGKEAFSGCNNLTSVAIPKGVTNIEQSAFGDCSSLTSVTIPNSVTNIGDYAFYSCSNLTSVTIPNSVTNIGDYAFYNCHSLTSVTIPNSVISVGTGAFEECAELTSVTISEGVTSIGDDAFRGCGSLTSVTIPNSVTSIGDMAFYADYNLKTPVYNSHIFVRLPCSYLGVYTIPSGIESIGSAFSGCNSLTSVTIPNGVTRIGDVAFEGCSNLTSVTIPNSVISIGEGAFYGCSSLTSVTIPNSVQKIDNNAFNSCKNLSSITISANVKEINKSAFDGCARLSSLTISEGATKIEKSMFNEVFKKCKGLATINLPNSVKSIGDFAFSGYSSLTSIIIPDSVTMIGNKAFMDCKNLTSITIPNSVTNIGDGAFRGCENLTSITIPNSVASVGKDAFYGCSNLTSVTIPNSVTNIGDGAFRGCENLTSITIPNSVASVGKDAFDSCRGLISVNIDDIAAWCNISFITEKSNPLYYAHHLFLNEKEVTQLVIPESIISIKDYAFCGGSNFTSVTIPNNLSEVRKDAFKGCSKLTRVIINNIASWCDIFFWTEASNPTSRAHHLYLNDTEITKLVIPNDVTRIKNYAFSGCYDLTSVKLSKNITSIGSSAFENCTDLTSVDIPNKVTSIGDFAFANCTFLKTIKIPKSTTSIGQHAFNGCLSLSLKIPKNVAYGIDLHSCKKVSLY